MPNDDHARQVGARIRSIRERQRMPQQHLATVMSVQYGHGWHQTHVSKTESGERPLRLAEAEHLADILGVPLGALVSDEPVDVARARREVDLIAGYVHRRRLALGGETTDDTEE